MLSSTLGVSLLLLATTAAHPGRHSSGEPCPYAASSSPFQPARHDRVLAERTGDGGVPEGGFQAVMDDLEALLTDSQDFWPADFGNYGGLFIRLAWHCSGSYRAHDGRGGCDGGRIRFAPESEWDDNGNLDRALQLLKPIKENYGSDLSWGDLIVLSGTVAIKSMGGPFLGFCGGRIDDADGSDSVFLGPSEEQEAIGPCLSVDLQGLCLSVLGTALGPTTVGLIYVNPDGPVDNQGNPVASGEDIRTAFGRMGFNDTESVSLIGGGHAFGKAHGACSDRPCGGSVEAEIGNNTFTSGFEGAWTTLPTTWTNQYFSNLYDYEWSRGLGPGGAMQWAPEEGPDIFMLTTDIAMRDDSAYGPISEMYRDDISLLEQDFAASWYRLTTQDMGPVTRCIGDMVPPAQPFQFALPDPPEPLPGYVHPRAMIQEIIDGDEDAADAFVNLAYQCASTFRITDYSGGCNGARIRFPPEADWPSNTGTADALVMLEPVKANHEDVSYADLIVLAGITALESKSSELSLSFCGGYVDAADGSASEALAPRMYELPLTTVTDDFIVKGLTPEQGVALASRGSVSSQYYVDLKAGNGTYTDEEMALLEGEFGAIVDMFAEEESMLLTHFAEGWTKLMTAGRYVNNRDSSCSGIRTPTLESNVVAESGSAAAVTTLLFVAMSVAALFM